MKVLVTSLLLVGLLSGCIVRTGPNYRARRGGPARACAPAYHWNGHQCVHNGRGHARGHRR